jgi:hypothetical protein
VSQKALPDGRLIASSTYPFAQNYGSINSPGTIVQNYITRSNAVSTSSLNSLYTINDSGTFTFFLAWSMFGTPLATKTARLELFKMHLGVLTATGLFDTVPAALSNTHGQVSASLTVANGDGLCVGVLQSGVETGAGWNLAVNVRAIP